MKELTDFDIWWNEHGSGIIPKKEEEHYQFAERLARAAWNYAQSIKQETAA